MNGDEDLITVSERLRARMLALADELDRWIDAVRRDGERAQLRHDSEESP